MKMPWQQLHPLCLFQSTCKSRQKGEKKGKQCKLWIFFFPGNLWPTWCSCWTMLAIADPPHHYDLQPLTQDRAGRIILLFLVNCSQITPLEAQLWFYNVQLLWVKWGWCFQETGALMECLCSGSSKVFFSFFYLILCWIMEVSILYPSNRGGMKLRSFTITLPVLTFIADLHFGPISRTICHEELFLLGQNWRLVWFFLATEQNWTVLLAILWFFWCWSELPSSFCPSCYELLLVGGVFLANVVWSIVLHAGKIQPTNLELILFSSVSSNTWIYFLQRTQTTSSSAWQTNRSTKKICIIRLSLLFISIFLGHLPPNK